MPASCLQLAQEQFNPCCTGCTAMLSMSLQASREAQRPQRAISMRYEALG